MIRRCGKGGNLTTFHLAIGINYARSKRLRKRFSSQGGNKAESEYLGSCKGDKTFGSKHDLNKKIVFLTGGVFDLYKVSIYKEVRSLDQVAKNSRNADATRSRETLIVAQKAMDGISKVRGW
jgi:hypothetical protein